MRNKNIEEKIKINQCEEINRIETVSETEDQANLYLINHNFNLPWLNTPVPDSVLSSIKHNVIVTPSNENGQRKQVALSGRSWSDIDLHSTSSTGSTVYQPNLLVPRHNTALVSPNSVTNHPIKKDDINIPNNGVIKIKHIVTEIIGISLVLIIISTCVSLKTLRNMSKNETIPVTHEISRSSVKSDDVYKLFNPFTIRPNKTRDRAPQPTSLPRPNNRGGYPPVSEISQLTTSGGISSVDETQSTIPGMVSGTTTKPMPGINTLMPVTPVVATSRRWIRW